MLEGLWNNTCLGIQIQFGFVASGITAVVVFILVLATMKFDNVWYPFICAAVVFFLMLTFPLIAILSAFFLIVIAYWKFQIEEETLINRSSGHVNAPSSPLDRPSPREQRARADAASGAAYSGETFQDLNREAMGRAKEYFKKSNINVYTEWNVTYNATTLIYEKRGKPILNHMITIHGEHIIKELSPNRRASTEVYRGSPEGAFRYINIWKG